MATSGNEKASSDYENPEQNVSDLPDPVTLSTNKARQGVLVPRMWLVLIISTALAAVGMGMVYLLS